MDVGLVLHAKGSDEGAELVGLGHGPTSIIPCHVITGLPGERHGQPKKHNPHPSGNCHLRSPWDCDRFLYCLPPSRGRSCGHHWEHGRRIPCLPVVAPRSESNMEASGVLVQPDQRSLKKILAYSRWRSRLKYPHTFYLNSRLDNVGYCGRWQQYLVRCRV
jgi:hypothetical protein